MIICQKNPQLPKQQIQAENWKSWVAFTCANLAKNMNIKHATHSKNTMKERRMQQPRSQLRQCNACHLALGITLAGTVLLKSIVSP